MALNPHEPCPIDGSDHVEHVYPVERFTHEMSDQCMCGPLFLMDAHGFFWLHFGVDPDAPHETKREALHE